MANPTWQDLQDQQAAGTIVIVGLTPDSTGTVQSGPRKGDGVLVRDASGQEYITRVQADGTLADPQPNSKQVQPKPTLSSEDFPAADEIAPKAPQAVKDYYDKVRNDPKASPAEIHSALTTLQAADTHAAAASNVDANTQALAASAAAKLAVGRVPTSTELAAYNKLKLAQQSAPPSNFDMTNPYVKMAYQAALDAGINPNIFLKQIQQESGFNPNAVSSAGALGIAQFMPGTAQSHGVDPRDPQSSLTGAAEYMKQLLTKYNGSYAKALGAYNAGEGTIDSGGPLPAETRNYISSILSGSGGAVGLGGGLSLPGLAGSGKNQALQDQLTKLQIQEAQQKLTPQVQLLFEQQSQTINSIGHALAQGQISMSEANQRYSATKAYTDAAVQGTTPYAIYEKQLADEQVRAQDAQNLITKEMDSGQAMSKTLLDMLGPSNPNAAHLTVMPSVPIDYNSILAAGKQSAEQYIPPGLSDAATSLLTSFYGGTPGLPKYGSPQIANGGQQSNTSPPVPGLDPNFVSALSPAVQSELTNSNNGANPQPPTPPQQAQVQPNPFANVGPPPTIDPNTVRGLLGDAFNPNQTVPYPADAQPVG